ncbi:MAG: hypothetical protein RL757_1067 [Bacteroidota bacterium]|jgi:1,4-dihydroxy-6-naphthoate synthase
MNLKIGFSPCPNDTFIFDAWVHQKIDTEGLILDVVMEDVEALNRRARAQELAVTKLSYHAFAHLLDAYQLLDAGSALGRGCGPLLISKQKMDVSTVNTAKIAIPGAMTTAHLLFGIAYPEATNRMETIFSEIENQVLNNQADAGVIIHENRFTYAEKGLIKIMDLGEFWEKTTQMPIPLGGIVAKRNLPNELKQKTNRVMARSVAFAFENPDESKNYVRAHAQEMSEEVTKQHIELYVNHFTQSLGDEGRAAVETLFEKMINLNMIKKNTIEIFINR